MNNSSVIFPCEFFSNFACWKEVIQERNNEWARLMVPVIAMMIVFMVVGTIGNILVLIVYSYRNQKTSANIFIMFLASMDLFSCAVIHPYIIYKQINNYDQTWIAVCKVFEFLVHFNLALSGLTLLLVAIDRYLAICRPVKFLTFDRHVFKAIASVTAVAFVGSLPILEFYGATHASPDVVIGDFDSYTCHYKTEYQNSTVLMAFGTFVMSCFMAEIVTMVILYQSVAKTAYKSRRVQPLSNAHILAGIKPAHSVSDVQNSAKTTATADMNSRAQCPSPCSIQAHYAHTLFEGKSTTFLSTILTVSAELESPFPQEHRLSTFRSKDSCQNENTKPDKSGNKSLNNRLKAAKMLFSVTAVFFLSWMPFLVLRICSVVNKNFWSSKSASELVFESLLNHVFYLNNAANPLIYTIINKNFRRDCKIVFRKQCYRKTHIDD